MNTYPSDTDLPIAAEAAADYIATTPRYAQLTAILGGKTAIKHRISSEMDLINLSRAGLPKRTVSALAKKLNISVERLSALLHISHRTLQRKAPADHLSVHVSEQILAIAEVIRRGLEVIGDDVRFVSWLHSDLRSLDFKKPIDLMDTSFGTQMLLRILGRVEHGVY